MSLNSTASQNHFLKVFIMSQATNKFTVAEAIELMAQYDCHMTLASLYAWIRCGKCPFGAYTKSDYENNDRGGYTVFRGRLITWLECQDMTINYRIGQEHPAVYESVTNAVSPSKV